MPNRRPSKKTKSPRKGTNGSKMLATLKSIDDAAQTNVRGRTASVPDVPRLRVKKDKVYTFHKAMTSVTLTASTTLPLLAAFQFDLTNTTDQTSFQTLFDCWRIAQISVEFIPLTTGPYAQPLFTVIDYDDANTPAAISDLLEYDTLEITQAGAFVTRTFVPHAALAAYSSTLFTNYARAPAGMWFDVATPTTKYYGLKYGIPALTSGTTTAMFQAMFNIVYQFKNNR